MVGILTLLVWVVILCIVAWLIWWIIDQFRPPEPIYKIAKVVVVVVFVILLIYILMGAIGGGVAPLPTIK